MTAKQLFNIIGQTKVANEFYVSCENGILFVYVDE